MDACIEWTGWRHRQGYGRVRGPDGKQTLLAHRVVWERTHGLIPAGMVVRHRCDNPPCINVDHLELGTQAENMNDAASRLRMRHVLTVAAVVEIRRLAKSGVLQREIGKQFGIRQDHVSRIVNRKLWAHV
jgi:predicted XRE-type DNA-binding protein